MTINLSDWLKDTANQDPNAVAIGGPQTRGLGLMEKYFPFTKGLGADEFDPQQFERDFPGLDLETYEQYKGQYPFSDLPIYDEFGQPYPELDLPRYTGYDAEHPELGPMYGEAGGVIGKFLSGEMGGLPIDEIMEAYAAEERRALGEELPSIREDYSAAGLLRSGMREERELEARAKSAEKRASYKAGLMKEDAVLKQEAMVTGIGLAMQHMGLGYGAQKDAYNSALNEYTKVYQSNIQAGMAEGEATERAWAAANQEYVRSFASNVDATKFAQQIKQQAYKVSRDEYTKVYKSGLEVGLAEYQAQAQAWEAARTEYARVQQMEFEKFMTELKMDFDREMNQTNMDAQSKNSLWSSIGSIIGSIFGGPIGGAIGKGIGGLFD